MTELGRLLLTAFAPGAQHALEVDHMVAVTAFVGGNPRLATALGFGLRWGLGHAVVVFVAGTALALSGLRAPPSVQQWAELGVGAMLVALGLWAARAARRLHVHPPLGHGDHAHLHAHVPGPAPHTHAHRADATHRHRHLSTLVGAYHGLAGTAPIVAILPVALLPSRVVAVAYLALFGAGTMLAMGVYAMLAALAASGLPNEEFLFVGFLPNRTGERRRALERLRIEDRTIILYEAPHRIVGMLEDVVEILGDLQAVVAREVTKVHEEFVRGSASEVLARMKQKPVRGEITVLVGPQNSPVKSPGARGSLQKEIEQVMEEQHLDERSALKRVARSRGISRSDAYRQWQMEKSSTGRG